MKGISEKRERVRERKPEKLCIGAHAVTAKGRERERGTVKRRDDPLGRRPAQLHQRLSALPTPQQEPPPIPTPLPRRSPLPSSVQRRI
jgi:hypothetical protein